MSTAADRALGALLALALGDALGMPTQGLSRHRAEELLGAGPALLTGPADNPVSAGMPAGSVTDDTEQALLLARLLVDGAGQVEPRRLAEELLSWEAGMAARGSLDLLGPSTKRAVEAVRAGADPATTGRDGRTNGAAMRITPIGIATPALPLARLVAAVGDACRVTHDTDVARAGAAAVAAVVSFGVDGATFAAAQSRAGDAAAHAGDPALGERIALATRGARRLAAASGTGAALAWVEATIGTSLATEESVPAAFAVAALSPDDAWAAAWLGARLGGDADTIAAIAAAMVGACTGAHALPADAVSTVVAVNALDLPPLVEALLALRRA